MQGLFGALALGYCWRRTWSIVDPESDTRALLVGHRRSANCVKQRPQTTANE